MAKPKAFENYPCRIVFLSNLVSFAIYAIGAFIMFQLGPIWMLIYLLYCAVLEMRLIKNHCVSCYYYGKYCAFGKGKISSLLFKKGDSARFIKTEMTWKNIIPDFLVSLIPLIAGIVLLILRFDWLMLLLIILLVILTTSGNGFIRSSFACKFCKQKEIGCPAEKLFNKGKK